MTECSNFHWGLCRRCKISRFKLKFFGWRIPLKGNLRLLQDTGAEVTGQVDSDTQAATNAALA